MSEAIRRAQRHGRIEAGADIFIGTAGWTIRRDHQDAFASGASHLARYAARLGGVEINSSFYRPHKPATYAKWAASVPPQFRFAVKIPRSITHEARLRDSADLLERFLGECTALGDRLGPLLIQLPPSLSFDAAVAKDFLAGLRKQFAGLAALEPRHESWFTPPAEKLLVRYAVARIAADPIPAKISKPVAAHPGGGPALVYYRLHGSPRVYYSDYGRDRLQAIAGQLLAHRKRGAIVWCIFDNTALGHATRNALDLIAMIELADDQPSLPLCGLRTSSGAT